MKSSHTLKNVRCENLPNQSTGIQARAPKNQTKKAQYLFIFDPQKTYTVAVVRRMPPKKLFWHTHYIGQHWKPAYGPSLKGSGGGALSLFSLQYIYSNQFLQDFNVEHPTPANSYNQG